MVFFALLSFVMGIVYLIYFGTGRRKNLYLLGFVSGKIIQGIAITMLGLKTEVDAFASPWLASVFMTLGLSIEAFVFISYDQVFRRNQFRVMLGFCLAGIVAVLLNKNASDAVIIICFNTALGGVYLSGAWFLWKRGNLSRFARVSMVSFFVFGLAWLYAVLYAILFGDGLDMLHTSNHSHVIIAVTALFNFNIVSLGYIMLQKELDEQQIRENAHTIERDNAQLKVLNATKDQFFSIIAHDLRGPIGGLAQLGEMLSGQHTELSDQEREHMLKLVADTSKNSFILLENLLLWARSESGELQVKKETIALDSLVESNIVLLDAVIEQKQAKVTNRLEKNLSIYADMAMISTVFRNLISNALKFIHPGGTIEIAAEYAKEGREIWLHVKDNGIGIPANKIKDLLSLDSKYTRTGTRNEGGSGLGLKLCNQFIQRHGGSLLIESVPDQGSRFTVCLPLQ